jgi:plasmid stability protein
MSDILIRDVPEDVVAAIDTRAAAVGLSRNEYLKRRLGQDARHGTRPVEVRDLQMLELLFADLTDPEVMTRAWS